MSEESRYKLNDKVPCDDNSIVSVIGDNHHLYIVAPSDDMTWKELIMKSTMDFKKRHGGTCLIIIENSLGGRVFKFGNYDRVWVYEQGVTQGYA